MLTPDDRNNIPADLFDLIDWTHSGTIIIGQSGLGGNDNVEELHTPQNSISGSSLIDLVKCYNQDARFCLTPLQDDIVSIFKASATRK